MLQRFGEAKQQIQPGKCAFAQPRVLYLIFVLSEKVFAASTENLKAVDYFPTSKCVKHVRSFWGLASFCRRMVPKLVDCEVLNDTNTEGQPV